MQVTPDGLDLIGNEVAIRWSDGSEDYFPMELLRAQSPSADNQGEQDVFGKTYGGTDQKEFPGVTVKGWVPVGGYGIRFSFSDGHANGIFSYEYLRRLAERMNELN